MIRTNCRFRCQLRSGSWRLCLLPPLLAATINVAASTCPTYIDSRGYLSIDELQSYRGKVALADRLLQKGDITAAKDALAEATHSGDSLASFVLQVRLAKTTGQVSACLNQFINRATRAMSEQRDVSATKIVGLAYGVTMLSGANSRRPVILDWLNSRGRLSPSQDGDCRIVNLVLDRETGNIVGARRQGEALLKSGRRTAGLLCFVASLYTVGAGVALDGKGRVVSPGFPIDMGRAEDLVREAIERDGSYARAYYLRELVVRQDIAGRKRDLRKFLELAPTDHPGVASAKRKLAQLSGNPLREAN